VTLFPLIPAPPFLLSHLLGLVFVVHVVFMNFVVAAPFVILWYSWFRTREERFVAAWLSSVLPVAFTFAINFGVACLLFIQTLFPDRFFTSNILLGGTWLSMILLLLLAFYGAYVTKAWVPKNRAAAGGVALVVGALMLCIAAVMVANYFMTTSRNEWQTLAANPFRIARSFTFLPRLLHFVIGSFALTGFWMVWISWWRARRGEDLEKVVKFRKHGLLLAMAATAVQVIVGVWFLLWLPADVLDRLFSGNFIGLVWISGVATGLVMLGMLVVANVFPNRTVWQRTATLLLVWTLFGMSAGRESVRLYSFDPKLHIASLPSASQSGGMLLFASVLGAGVLTLLWLFWLVRKSPNSPAR
jgi:hypothetical protein